MKDALKKLALVPVVASAAVAVPAVADDELAGTRPNVIFILVDDMGWGDMDCNWQWAKTYKNGDRANAFKTPELNKMAQDGILMTRHYSACPVSAPARASLITGVHQGHARQVRDNTFDTPIEDAHTLGSVMRGAGYATAVIGKWGLGGIGDGSTAATAGARPRERGFDYFYGIFDHMAGHFHYPANSGRYVWENETDVTASLKASGTPYSTDLFTAAAKQWIKKQAAKKKPFFLYLSYPAPHGSLRLPNAPYPKGGGLHGGVQWVKDSVNTAAAGTPDTYVHPDNLKFSSDAARRHATMIRRVDESIGDLRALLRDLKIADDTLIVFTSDNGPHNEPGNDSGNGIFGHTSPAQDPSFFKSYGMMDGIKRDCWEGGMREPTVLVWGKKLTRKKGKGVISEPTQFQDWMATLADLAGVEVPARSDGVSIVPLLTNGKRELPSRIYVEYSFGGTTAKYKDFSQKHIQSRKNQIVIGLQDEEGKWFKGISHGENLDFEIYDTLEDPQELKNLAGMSDKFKKMQKEMRAKVLRSRRAFDGDRSDLRRFDFSDKNFLAEIPVPALEKRGAAPGLKKTYYCKKKAFDWVPDFRQSRLAVTEKPKTPVKGFGMHCEGFVDVPATGDYVFALKTKGKAFVRLHDMQLIDADKLYVPGTEATSYMNVGTEAKQGIKKVKLEKGTHAIRIDYIAADAKDDDLQLFWILPDGKKEAIPEAAFSH
ncbi:MAG: sulfatase-like hydrolase/transferase [Opitutales bacterium]|nr:sulfatase-like hydrolase/transferase [Opitutales bacterium]